MATFIVGLAIIGIAAIAVLYLEKVFKSTLSLIVGAALIFASLAIRIPMADHISGDYVSFLSIWVQYFRDGGGFEALKEGIGNYNVPYYYFLAAFSYSSAYDLYLIKLLSIFFDFVLAYGVMRLVNVFHKKPSRVLLAFYITIFMPTVVLNGAYWGQCDSIYVAFAVWSIYLALDDHPIASMVCIAASFTFKLQAVFVMPVFLLFLYTKRIKWWHFAFFPLTYIAIIMPVVFLGRPFWETLLLYFSQATSIGDGLNYNSPSIFAMIKNVNNTDLASNISIACAAAFLIVILSWLFTKRKNISNHTALCCVVLFSIAVPLLLPHMHDRYFFMSDVLTVALAVVTPAFSVSAACVSFASLICYYGYFKGRYLITPDYGTVAIMFAAILIILYMVYDNGLISKKVEKQY